MKYDVNGLARAEVAADRPTAFRVITANANPNQFDYIIPFPRTCHCSGCYGCPGNPLYYIYCI